MTVTFPRVILTELAIGGVDGDWANISSDVRQTEPVVITRGKSDEASQTPPGNLSLILNNRLGRYSPRNPLGPYYGQIGRNTPIRVSLGDGPYGLILSGGFGAAAAPDTVGLSITGDIDIRIDMEMLPPTTWANSADDLINKWVDSGNQRSWALIRVDDDLSFRWSTDGSNFRRVFSNALPSDAHTAVRVTLDVDNGAGSHAVNFYTAPSMDGPWTLLAGPLADGGGGTTSIFDSTAAVRVGAASQAGTDTWGSSAQSAVFEVEIRNGIGGTIVASPDFAAQPLDPDPISSAAFTDAQGNTWTPTGTPDAARIWYGSPIIRLVGEVSEWPAKWDTSGNDAWVPIQAADILRRIGQGSQPVGSSLKEYLVATGPKAYWALDEGTAAVEGSVTASHDDGASTRFYRDPYPHAWQPTASFGDGDLGAILAPGLKITTTGVLGGVLRGDLTMLATVSTWTFDFVYKSSILGPLTARVYTFYNASSWQLNLRGDGTNNDILLRFIDESSGSPASTDLADTAALDAITDGQLHHVRLTLTQDGADVDYTVYVDGTSVLTGTRTSQTLGGVPIVRFTYLPTGDDTPVAIGHVVFWDESPAAPSIVDTALAAAGYAGETAGRRVERLCDEQDVPFTSVGDLDATLAMGPQFTDYFSNQLAEIEATDRGLLYGARDSFALEYRTRTSLYNQAAAATIDYSAGELAPPFEPTDDDQATRNDVFAQRREGGSYQATLSTGALSVLEPPDGVGRYKDEQTVNVETDDMLPTVAGWLLRLGTVDEARFPKITVNLHNRNVVANTTLSAALLTTDIGDRIIITGADNANIYDDISMLALGYTETLLPFEHILEFNAVPASPYEVMEIEDSDNQSRIGPGDGSTLNEALDTTETGVDVASDGFLWTTDAAQMPISIMIGGEEMSITAISGASSPQTFTVTRSVNSVVKEHDSGGVVRLKRRAAWAL